MAVNVTVGTSLPARRDLLRGVAKGTGLRANVYKAIARSLQGDSVYVTSGTADLDAEGYVTAFLTGDPQAVARRRDQVVNCLRATAPTVGDFSGLLDACADAIENA